VAPPSAARFVVQISFCYQVRYNPVCTTFTLGSGAYVTMAEALGIVSLAIQLTSSIDRIISFFDSVENSPRALRSFYNSARRLERYSMRLEETFRGSNPTGLELTADDRARLGLTDVDEALRAADSLLQGWQESNFDRGPVANTIWNIRQGRQLDEQRNNIERIYWEVFSPMWFSQIL